MTASAVGVVDEGRQVRNFVRMLTPHPASPVQLVSLRDLDLTTLSLSRAALQHTTVFLAI
jgi:hypothetical protein